MKSGKNDRKQLTQPSTAEINSLVALYNERNYDELERQARILIDRFPDFGFGWQLLGGALQRHGKDALHAFQKAAELMPDDAGAHYNLGFALKNSGQFNSAVLSYRRAIQIKPRLCRGLLQSGQYLQIAGAV